MSITENVKQVKDNIARAAVRCGRAPEEITLVAASKMNDEGRVREAIAAGVTVCGENRVQELLEKHEQGAYEGAKLHFIGTLQKNKVKYIVGLVSLIHSVSDLGLLEEISRRAVKKGIVQDILLEVNIGAEASKSGFAPGEIAAVLEKCADFGGVRVRGLMAIPPICTNSDEIRRYFSDMRKLFIDNSEKKYDNVNMELLSMGMSSDYEIAIEEGANMVRVGTGIFGARHYAG